ncbi:MAG: HAD-IC family P-type ATPase [Clostridia bacterium]|nr:HAD-IC family P-type ATPase [Clostridia bacterium]
MAKTKTNETTEAKEVLNVESKQPSTKKSKKSQAVQNNEQSVVLSAENDEAEEFAEAPTKKIQRKEKRELKKAQKNIKKQIDDSRDNEELGIRDVLKMLFHRKKKDKPVEYTTKRVKRIKADYRTGLNSEQVQERIYKGQTNLSPNTNVKTIRSIIFENVFTFFNILCFLVAGALIVVDIIYDQPWSNVFFMLIIIVNILIGIIQELRAKKTIEKLSLLTAPVVKVVRDGNAQTVKLEEVVLDDIVVLSTGKQIVADCIVIEGNVEVNESMLTGESLPIKKKVGDTILAGSFVVSGHCHARVEKVGANNYIQQLASTAKKYKKPKSELFSSLKLIIKIIGILIVPIGILMYITASTLPGSTIVSAITTTAGSIIGMIPAGMFLLCSVSLTVSVIRLAQKKALVQDLYCVEMLARVNVLCLDKTGTITDGTMKVFNCVQVGSTKHTIKRIMGSMLSALGDNNQTSQALINYFGYNKELTSITTIPFSSSRKLSAVSFDGNGTYIMGAPEFVMPTMKDEKLSNMIEQYAKDGYRTFLLAHSNKYIEKDTLPDDREAIALIILEDHIRENAAQTIAWFKNNGVTVKIISGDNPLTVSEIAKRVGVEGTDSFISLDGLNDKQVIAAANKYTVFGRVTPEQKALLIKTIKSDGNTVAMTGDGVNDILALKEADCSIAMASGNEAVRSVSHMVLLNSDFSSMPDTVLEGRKVINNVQKSSSLFFMKTLFSLFFSILVIVAHQAYPFTTNRMLLFEVFVVGIPSFILAFMPNDKPIKGRFIYNLIKNALPGALTLVINIAAVYIFNLFMTGSMVDAGGVVVTMSTIILTITGLAMLYKLCKPFNGITITLFISMFVLCFVAMIVWPGLFGIINIFSLSVTNILFLIILSLLAPTIINILYKLIDTIPL